MYKLKKDREINGKLYKKGTVLHNNYKAIQKEEEQENKKEAKSKLNGEKQDGKG
jgi:hypothetical protein